MRLVMLCVLFGAVLAPCAVCFAGEGAEAASLGAKLVPVLGAITFTSLILTAAFGFLLRRGKNVFKIHLGFA